MTRNPTDFRPSIDSKGTPAASDFTVVGRLVRWNVVFRKPFRVLVARVLVARVLVAMALVSIMVANVQAQTPPDDASNGAGGLEVTLATTDTVPTADPADGDGADEDGQDGDEDKVATPLDVAYQSIQQWLRANVAPPLQRAHEPIDRWLGTLSLEVALSCALGLYAVAVIWVWTLRREFVFRGAPSREWWRDLRLWATLVVVPYVAIYWILGY